MTRYVKFTAGVIAAAVLVACGGDGGNDDDNGGNPNPPDPTLGVFIGGNLTGLSVGRNVVLRNNGADDLRLQENGKFAFSKVMDRGSKYSVTVATQPEGQTCTVGNGSGDANADVNNVTVQCVDAAVQPPSPPPTTQGTESCLDNPNFRVAGNTWTITTDGTDEIHKSIGETDFRGNKAYRIDLQNTVGGSWSSYSDASNGKHYTYGTSMWTPAVVQRHYSPAMVYPLSLPMNETYSQTLNDTQEQAGGSVTVTLTNSYTYLGRELITTELGTLETCKVEFSTDSSLNGKMTWHHWYVASGKYAGFIARTISASGTTQPSKIVMNWSQ